MNNSNMKFETVLHQEKTLEFKEFSRKDALAIGPSLLENAKKYNNPIAIEITLNRLVIFRYFSDGTILNNDLWLSRKKNTVDLMSMSSLRFLYWLEMNGETISDCKLDPNNYATFGGGFPINLHGTGMVGTICVSGLPNNLDDHQLIVETLADFLKIELELLKYIMIAYTIKNKCFLV
jgi:uncharacterized protein (UPF0303 family)